MDTKKKTKVDSKKKATTIATKKENTKVEEKTTNKNTKKTSPTPKKIKTTIAKKEEPKKKSTATTKTTNQTATKQAQVKKAKTTTTKKEEKKVAKKETKSTSKPKTASTTKTKKTVATKKEEPKKKSTATTKTTNRTATKQAQVKKAKTTTTKKEEQKVAKKETKSTSKPKTASTAKKTEIKEPKNNLLSNILIALIISFSAITFVEVQIKELNPVQEISTSRIQPSKNIVGTSKIKKGVNIKKIQEQYQNQDIIGYLEIPDVLSLPIVKAEDNAYYLDHNLKREKSTEGAPFMDYRVSFEDRKILIYGHTSSRERLPFLLLHQYSDESFYREHPTVYLYSEDKVYTYEIFSSYLEPEDYDYVNIKSFRGMTWNEHINKLKEKSNYKTDHELTDNSKILILQTCSVSSTSSGGKYQLVIAVLTKIEENNQG